jgi:Na+/proline symporter
MVDVPPHVRWLLGTVLVLYLLGLVLLSIVATRKVHDEADYLVAGRRLPLFLAWGTLIATWFGAAAMIGSAEAAREEGLLGVVLDPFACAATLVLAGLFFAKPLWRMKLLTISDFYREKYGPTAEFIAGVVQVISYFGWIAAQYVALASIQQLYFGIHPNVGLVVGAAVTLFYTMIGGMWSVTLTDTVQIVVAFVGLVVLADATFFQLGGGSILNGLEIMLERTWQENPDHLLLVPVAGAAATLAWVGDWSTGLFGNIPGQDLQQRVFAARDEKTAAWACILAGIAYFCFGMIPVSLGLLSNLTDPGAAEGKILPLLAGKYLSPLMVVVFVVSLVSMIVSTATSAVLAPAAILGHNLFGRLSFLKNRKLLVDRLSVLLVSLGGLSLAFWGEKIMGLLDVSLSIALVGLFVPLLFGLYGKPRGELPGVLSIVSGTVLWLVRFLMEEVFVPITAAAEDAGQSYAAYVGDLYPAARVGTAAHAALYAFALVPADLWGLGISFAGYFLGQWVEGKRRKV